MNKSVVFSALSLLSLQVFADQNHQSGMPSPAISHAPISVMGDHLHKAGEWMVSYRYMDMKMEGLLSGDDSISLDDVLDDYMMAPKKMDMKMHMLGMMYAPTDDVTLMLMVNYLDNEMDSVMRMPAMDHGAGHGMSDGMSDMHDGMHADMVGNMDENMDHMMTMDTAFSTSSSGLGDTRVSALINAFNEEHYRSHFTVGISIPTGDIDQKDSTPMNPNALLGYRMQLGSGSYHLFGAFTFVYDKHDWQFGTQFNYETALEYNDEDYRKGDKILWQNWLAYSVTHNVSVSARLALTNQEETDGADARLNPMMMPTADPMMTGYNQLDGAIGVNYVFTQGALKGHRIALEYITPIDQDVDGIQMETDSTLVAGWQYAF